MFHWICPECGREIAPTVRECPACDPNAVAAEPALVGVVEAPPARLVNTDAPPARLVNTDAPPARLESSDAPPARLESTDAPPARLGSSDALPAHAAKPEAPARHATADTPPVRLVSKDAAVRTVKAAILRARPDAPEQPSEEPSAPPAQRLKSSARPARALAPPPQAVRSEALAEQLSQTAEPILPQFDAAPSDNPLENISAALDEPHAAPERRKDPPPSEERFPISAPSPSVPPVLRAWIADLGPAPEKTRTPVTGTSQAKPQAEPPLVVATVAIPQPPARSVAFISARAEDAPLEALPVAPSKPVEVVTPYSGPVPALADLTNYSPLAGRPMRPAVPQPHVLKNDSAPRTTLPGPMLTSKLVKFQDPELNPVLPERRLVRSRWLPGWVVTVMIVGTVLGAGFSSVFSIVPRSGSETKASGIGKVEAAEPESVPATVPVTPTTASNALSRTIEVTGFRVQADPGKKSAIQYLVVNHTAAYLGDVTIYVTLHSAKDAPGQPPFAKFQFGAPELGPYESKEMSIPFDRANRPGLTPSWQDLRADVEIGQ